MEITADLLITLRETFVENSRKKLIELGGTWISQYHHKEEGICDYIARKFANHCMKGEFDIDEKIKSNPHFEDEAAQHFQLAESLNKTVHDQVYKSPSLKEIQVIIANLISVKSLNLNDSLSNEDDRNKLEQLPALLQRFSARYSNLYDNTYIDLLAKLNDDPSMTKCNDKLLPGLTYKKYLQVPVTAGINKLPDEICLELLPHYGEATVILIRDKHHYVFDGNGKKAIGKNIGHQNPHYISICFNAYQNQPAFFITDANLGLVMFKDFVQFKLGLEYLLLLYINTKTLLQPQLMVEHFCNQNIMERQIMTAIEWQAKFAPSPASDSLPTASLMQQNVMPNWAKLIYTNLCSYEKLKNPWEKVKVISQLKQILENASLKAQIEADITAGKISKVAVTNFSNQLTVFFESPQLLIKPDQNKHYMDLPSAPNTTV